MCTLNPCKLIFLFIILLTWSGCFLLISLSLVSKTFQLYMDITFLTFIVLSCYIFFLSWFILWQKGETWHELFHVLACMSCILILIFFISCSHYLDLIILFIYFPTHYFSLGIHVLVRASYRYWDLIVYRCIISSFAYDKMIRFRRVLWVLGGLYNYILSQKLPKKDIVRALHFHSICWQFCSFPF